ncbi:MAG: glycosyltransferase [Steroidobacteraceae bacterium]
MTEPNGNSRFGQRSEAEQAAFVGAVLQASREAEKRVAPLRAALRIAGCRIDVLFTGARMVEQLLPALRHNLIGDGSAAKAVVHVWDTTTTGARMPPPPCGAEHFTDRGDIWGFKSTRYRIVYQQAECAVNVMDLATGEAAYWVHHPENMPFWTKASPLRTILHWTLEKDGAQLLHAAAIGDTRGAVLLTGKGGIGKSTTSLAALRDGLSYVGDDYVAVRLTPAPQVFSLYCTAKLNAQDMEKFPALAAHVTNVPSIYGEKAVIDLRGMSSQLRVEMPLRAVLTPRVIGGLDTDFVPADPLTIRRAAAFTTLAQLPYAGQQTQDFIERLVDSLPCFTLRLGTDMRRVTLAIESLLVDSEAGVRSSTTLEEPPVQASGPTPLVSVIVPVYNGATFLRDAIDSILAQNYPSLEILVIDDGSQDDIDAAVARLPVDVRFVRQPNRGPAGARNRGVGDASGSIIAFLDVDDLWPPGTLRILLRELAADPNLQVVQGDALVLVRDAASGHYDVTGDPELAFPFYIGAALYRRSVFEKIGLFDDRMRLAEDTDWYMRLQESGLTYRRVDHVSLHVRRHGGNMTLAVPQSDLIKSTMAAIKKSLDRTRGTGRPPR